MTFNSGLTPLTSDLQTSSSGSTVSSSRSFPGTLPPLPDPTMMTSKPFRSENSDVYQVAQAVAQIIGHSFAPQMQADAIAVGTSSKGT